MLTSPRLKEHADIHIKNEEGFIGACQYEHLDVLRFFVFDMNIEKNKDIVKCLKDNPKVKEAVENMFKLRSLNEKLNNKLKHKPTSSHKLKL